MSDNKHVVPILAAMLCIGAIGTAIAFMLVLGGMSAAIQSLDRVFERVVG